MLEKILLILVVFLPFQFALQPGEGVDLALIRVIIIGAVFLWLLRSLAKGRIFLPRPIILFFFSGFILWSTVSFLWSENVLWSARKGLFLLSIAPLFLVFFSVARDEAFRRRLFPALSLGAFVTALFALTQFFSQFFFGVERVFAFWIDTMLPFFLGQNFGGAVAQYPSLLVNISGKTLLRASGPFPDPHIASFFFGMTFLVTLGLVFESTGRQRIVWALCAGTLLFADLCTFSRGGYLGLFFGTMVFSFSVFSKILHWKKYAFRGILVGIFATVTILVGPVGSRFLSSFSGDDGSNVERLRLWYEAGVFFSEQPLLGVGLGNYPLLVKPSAGYREPIYAHNLYLDIALETGVIGLLFFLGLLFFCLRAARRDWSARGDGMALAIFSALVLFLTHSFFETPLFSVHIFPLLLLLLAASIV